MEQQQFKVSFSLGTKLLLSIVSLLVIIIVFLNTSTLLLLLDDKRAYVYQSQSTEAVLAGRELVNTFKHSLDTLRLSLASVDPKQPPSVKSKAALQSVVDNQSDIILSSILLIKPASGQMTPHTQAFRAESLKQERLTPSELTLTQEELKPVLGELEKNGFAFVNVTPSGISPLVGILVGDLKLENNPAGMPVGFGVLSLRDFSEGVRGLNLTLATTSGRVLYDSDLSQVYAHRILTATPETPLFAASRASTLTEGALEFEQGGVRYLGSYVLPGYELTVLNKMEWKKAIRSAYMLGEKFVLLGLVAIVVAVLFAIVFSRTMTSPINRLYEATREVSQGNFDLELKPSGRDEIGALTASFNVMSKKISGLIRESMEKVQLENELAIASTVQQTLIPPSHFEDDRILIESCYQSASQCGGDWWGFFGVGQKYGLMIADATGHGFPSALITASARSCFSVLQKLAQETPEFSYSPAAMLSYANRVIFDASLAKIMMTFFVGVIDFETGMLKYSSAGHNPPWLFRKEGDRYQLNSLVATGPRLGETRSFMDFEEKEIPVSPDDILFLYTDGLIEGKNLEGDMFGKKRMRKIVEQCVANGPRPIIDQLMQEFMAHNQGKPLDDDVTIAVAKIKTLQTRPA